jgi:hypothetical protein
VDLVKIEANSRHNVYWGALVGKLISALLGGVVSLSVPSRVFFCDEMFIAGAALRGYVSSARAGRLQAHRLSFLTWSCP